MPYYGDHRHFHRAAMRPINKPDELDKLNGRKHAFDCSRSSLGDRQFDVQIFNDYNRMAILIENLQGGFSLEIGRLFLRLGLFKLDMKGTPLYSRLSHLVQSLKFRV